MTNLLIGFALGYLARGLRLTWQWWRRIPPDVEDPLQWFEDEYKAQRDLIDQQIERRKSIPRIW